MLLVTQPPELLGLQVCATASLASLVASCYLAIVIFLLLRALFYLDSLVSPEMEIFLLFDLLALLVAKSLKVQLFKHSKIWDNKQILFKISSLQSPFFFFFLFKFMKIFLSLQLS